MAAIAVPPRKARGAVALTLVWLVIGGGLLAASTVALYNSTRNDLLTAYNAAPACATFADAAAGKDCRFTTTGVVVELGGDSETTYVDVLAYGQPFEARLPVQDTSPYVGEGIQVEFWQLKVTRLGGVLTVDHPANDIRPRTLLVIGLFLLPLGLGAATWGVVRARRQMREGPGETATGPGMAPLAASDVLWR